MSRKHLKKYFFCIVLLISGIILGNYIEKNFIKKQKKEIENTLIEENNFIDTKKYLEKSENYYRIKEIIGEFHLVDINQDGEKDIVYLRRRQNIDDDKHLFYSYTWKSRMENIELEDVFLDIIDGKTNKIYSTPFEREEKEYMRSYYVDEIKILYPKENKPIFYISTECIGEGLGVQKRFRLFQCKWDKVDFIWSMEYEMKTGIEAIIHYLSNYMTEIIIDQEIIAQIDLEKVLDKSYFEYIKKVRYNQEGMVIKQEYETISDIENRYCFIEVFEKNIVAKAVLGNGAYDIGMLVVEYYFEDGELFYQYRFEETKREES